MELGKMVTMNHVKIGALSLVVGFAGLAGGLKLGRQTPPIPSAFVYVTDKDTGAVISIRKTLILGFISKDGCTMMVVQPIQPGVDNIMRIREASVDIIKQIDGR